MGDKPNNSQPAISLPKGGGAIKGIGETFQPNLFTGTGNFSVPIFTSPGRAGFGPQLTLQYSTGNGNGPFGLGWQLSIPRITRKTEKGLPKYTDEDVFVMSGAEDLVPKFKTDTTEPDVVIRGQGENTYTVQRYCPRTEGLFARIEKWVHEDSGDVHWRATTKDNVASIYGRTSNARILDPENPDHIFEWLLQETYDAKGNHILYEYAGEDPNLCIERIYEQNRDYSSQRYIRRIYYGNAPAQMEEQDLIGPRRMGIDHTNHLNLTPRRYLFEVLFDYGDLGNNDQPAYGPPAADGTLEFAHEEWTLRDDAFSSFRSGFEIRTLRRCRRVLMVHHFKELGDSAYIVKSTDFQYCNDDLTCLSLLTSATIRGYRKENNQYRSAAMPPVSFEYSQFQPQKQHYQSLSARNNDLPPFSLKNPETTLVDLFGNGLPDILHTTSTGYYYWENLGNGRLDMRHPLHTIPAGLTLSQPGVAFADLGGDGLPDLMVVDESISGFFEATPDGGWKPFKKINYPSFGLNDPNVRLVDLTGDGRSDALMTLDHHFLWFECKGEEGYGDPQAVERIRDLDQFPDIYFSDPSGRVRLADMTGDGLNDIVLVHNGRIDYWPNLGYGRFGRRIVMQNAPHLEYNFDPSRLFLADLDGSGCADLVYVDFGKVYFWLNRSGNGWSPEQVIHGTPYVTDLSSVQFADVFGSGTATLVWSYDFDFQPGGNYKALDFCGGIKPNLLIEMDNNMGATTRVQYAPSTKFYLEDKENGHHWATNLPFPVQVVEKVEAIDHIGKTKLVTTYKYHHGYFDGREREFRGFGRVDQFDTEIFDDFKKTGLHDESDEFINNDHAFHVPPVETRTWFHTGIYFDEDRLVEDGKFFDHHELMDRYRLEYFRKDEKAFHLANHEFEGLVSEAPHEAYRALRGALLRSEVYTRDDTDKQDFPYVVAENRYLVKQLQPKTGNHHGAYLTTNREAISYHYERNPHDPRVGHEITMAVDEFGNITDKISIGYPRRIVPKDLEDLQEQGELKILYTRADFINKHDEVDFYYIGIPCENQAFEVTGYDWNWDRPAFLVADFDVLMTNIHFNPYEWKQPEEHDRVEKRLVEWTRSYFRRNTSTGEIDPITPTNHSNPLPHRLRFREIESLGLPYETYQAVFTSIDRLKKQLGDNEDTDENLFRIKFDISADLLIEGGYHHDRDVADYWWIPSGRQNFIKNNFYLSEKIQDPFGSVSSIEHDHYGLLINKTVDPLENTIEAKNNYRVLQPYAVTDPNQNLSVVRFDDLGFIAATAVMGKRQPDGTWEGDYLDPEQSERQTSDNPTTKLEYDLFRWKNSSQPNYVKTLAREKHKDDNTRWQESYLYSDGFGREVQTKIQAEPGDATKLDSNGNLVTTQTDSRWVGTGRTIFNNKGKPVKQYEPFFSHTHEYENEAALVEWGVTPVLFYDPLERVVCTIHPNDTYEKVIFDPWRQISWDANDTVLLDPRSDENINCYTAGFLSHHDAQHRTEHPGQRPQTWHQRCINGTDAEIDAATKTKAHAATPGTACLDSLGRTFLTVADNGNDQNGAPGLFETRVKLDIEGHDLEINDPRFTTAFVHRYDIVGRKVLVDSVDAGKSAVLPDVDGNPIRTQDANGNWTAVKYDKLRRPEETVIHRTKPYRDIITGQVTIYGESLNNESAVKNNQRGRVFGVFDGAGAVFNLAYDFKGNLEKTIRRLSMKYKDHQIDWKDISAIGFVQPLLDLEPDLEPLLEKEIFLTVTAYDALNRVTTSMAPDHSDLSPGGPVPADGSIYTYGYNEANLLESLTVNIRQNDGTRADHLFVDNIDYNARGQRERIFYGNGLTTTYSYDPHTFRLVNLKSDKVDGSKVQELSYTYDPVGNITRIHDGVFNSVFNRNDVIKPENCYTYDPTYRLIKATGREHENMTACHYKETDKKQTDFFGITTQPKINGQALGKYTEKYQYDRSGNITLIDHNNETYGKRWKRHQEFSAVSNRIRNSEAKKPDPDSPGAEISVCTNEDFTIPHDLNGNILKLPHLPEMIWDYKNQLVEVQTNVGSNPNRSHYQYDAAGQRVRKQVHKNNGTLIEERIYLGSLEIYRKRNGNNGTNLKLERKTLHVMDDQQRIALVETRTAGEDPYDSRWRRFRFQLENHLGSSAMEIEWGEDRYGNWQADILSYEEYYPYGGTSYIAGRTRNNQIAPEVKRKRYRYSGKERDEETGFYYYGARYYAPWLGIWIAPDPAGLRSGLNLYLFTNDNFIKYIDTAGKEIRYFQILFGLAEPTEEELTEYIENPTKHNWAFIGTGAATAAGAVVAVAVAPAAVAAVGQAGTIVVAGAKVGATGLAVGLAGETLLDVGNVAIACADVYSTSGSGQSVAGLTAAMVDLGTGPNIIGELNTTRVAGRRQTVGTYEEHGGHHVHQSASYAAKSPADKNNLNHKSAVTVQLEGHPSDKTTEHGRATTTQRLLNKGKRGHDIDEKVGQVEIKATGEGRLKPPEGDEYFEDVKAFYALRASKAPGLETGEEVLKVVNKSTEQLNRSQTTPVRVPSR